jgi:hypothetical protein
MMAIWKNEMKNHKRLVCSARAALQIKKKKQKEFLHRHSSAVSLYISEDLTPFEQ